MEGLLLQMNLPKTKTQANTVKSLHPTQRYINNNKLTTFYIKIPLLHLQTNLNNVMFL